MPLSVPDKSEYPGLLKSERRNIAVLRARRDYLQKRLADGASEAAASYHASEQSALDWVLDRLDAQFAASRAQTAPLTGRAIAPGKVRWLVGMGEGDPHGCLGSSAPAPSGVPGSTSVVDGGAVKPPEAIS